MNILLLGLSSATLYLFGTIYQWLVFNRKIESRTFISLTTAALAILSHGVLTIVLIRTEQGLDFSFFKASLLIAVLVSTTLFALNFKKPMQNLILAANPICIITIICVLAIDVPSHQLETQSAGILTHITLSVFAYSVFTLSAAQAALLHLQNQALKKHSSHLILKNLPPLQTMERVLFELLTTGVVLLGLAIVAGFLFVDDIFAQHLVHKTAFSLLAFMLFAVLLGGRKRYGWRGATASKWTLWGCLFLMLGYFGSKFALEFLLSKR
ncbi:MAG: cytochrome c biogenesis protein CcsA [Pseudomonadales bacterium]|uniref:Cytochrome c assembly protein n=1 Tax=Oleiphilus messinensis TaxID=141451 RepID=A0A1Y0I512_9GAMM|nr:cytochrome c biogenesis protein CcsA [Oleiphilus messinensis]ARU55299.1 cytochrome c assembly protein [Oleiphilus messinensis]MCG8613119.1 cytochrome c biogenesis protein CcsA [Pseudomonadales bacterium]